MSNIWYTNIAQQISLFIYGVLMRRLWVVWAFSGFAWVRVGLSSISRSSLLGPIASFTILFLPIRWRQLGVILKHICRYIFLTPAWTGAFGTAQNRFFIRDQIWGWAQGLDGPCRREQASSWFTWFSSRHREVCLLYDENEVSFHGDVPVYHLEINLSLGMIYFHLVWRENWVPLVGPNA